MFRNDDLTISESSSCASIAPTEIEGISSAIVTNTPLLQPPVMCFEPSRSVAVANVNVVTSPRLSEIVQKDPSPVVPAKRKAAGNFFPGLGSLFTYLILLSFY